MNKPEYIKFTEKESKTIYSELRVFEPILFDNIEEKNLTVVYMKTESEAGKFSIVEKLYRTNHGFYLFIQRNKLNKSEGSIQVYYGANQYNELLFFIKPFLNSIKK